jgi:putative transposase
MIKSLKVRLKPNNKQQTKLFEAAGTARFAYNWALNRQIENYKTGGKFLSDSILRVTVQSPCNLIVMKL